MFRPVLLLLAILLAATTPALGKPPVIQGTTEPGLTATVTAPAGAAIVWQIRTPPGSWRTLPGSRGDRTVRIRAGWRGSYLRVRLRIRGEWRTSAPRLVRSRAFGAPAPTPPAPPAPAAQTPEPARQEAAALPPAPTPPDPPPDPGPPPAPDPGPAPPALGVQDDRLPITPPAAVPARLALLAATGVRVTRFDVLWSDVAPVPPADATDPDDPAYRWDRVDATVRGLAARGIAPLVSVYSAPGWASEGPGPPPGSPVSPDIPDPADFGAFMEALTARYSGGHRPSAAETPLPEVTHVELWNEPNLGSFMTPQRDGDARPAREAYLRMVPEGHAGARRGNPGVTVVAGALGSGGEARAWRDALIAADAPMDAFSQHLYPRAAPLTPTPAYPSWSSITEIRTALDAWRPDLPLVVSEAGYTTAETPFRPPGVSVTEDEQARRLTDILGVPEVRAGDVAAIIWFNLQDNAGWPSGLLRGDGSAKPSRSAFVAAVGERAPVPLPRAQAPVVSPPG